MTSFEVYGSHGELTVASQSGRVLEYRPDGDGAYAAIRFFNVAEWRQAYPGAVPTVIDILDIGYWTEDGVYVAPEVDWRSQWSSAKIAGIAG